MKASISRFFNTCFMLLKKHAPEILTVVGVVGVGAGVVMVCKATTKVEEKIDEFSEKKAELDQEREVATNIGTDVDGNPVPVEEIEHQYRQDLTKLYVRTGWEFIKLYGPGVAVITGSLASLVGANGILKKRNVSLVAAYAALKDKYDTHMANTAKLLEKGIKDGKLTLSDKDENKVIVEDPDDQRAVINEVNKELANKYPDSLKGKPIGEYSEYARFFDESCSNWVRDPSSNLSTLTIQERYANQLLVNRGHVLLNDVYDMLGIPRTSEGAVVGWVYDSNDPEKRISFGVHDIKSEAARRFVNGYEPSILLDFNVDGIIYDKITPSWAKIYE